eukprot:6089297-Pleurochrysis_carterae.AAC.4
MPNEKVVGTCFEQASRGRAFKSKVKFEHSEFAYITCWLLVIIYATVGLETNATAGGSYFYVGADQKAQ